MFFRRFRLSAGHLKETENYVRLALHFKGERQRARLLEHRRGAMSGRLLCPENGRFHYTPKRCRAAKSLLQGISMEV